MFKAINGLRSLLHISVIAVHIQFFGTAHFLSTSDFNYYYKTNSLIGRLLLFGGIQVDGFFAISAFLHVLSALDSHVESDHAFLWFRKDILKRYIRLSVVNIPFIFLCRIFTLDYNYIHPSYKSLSVLSGVLLMRNNYQELMTISDGAMWSTNADFQISCIFSTILAAAFWFFDAKKSKHLRSVFVFISFLIISILSLYNRASKFDLENANEIKSGIHGNFVSYFNCKTASHVFLEKYNYTVDPREPCHDFVLITQRVLYCPTLMRISSLGVGGMLGVIFHNIHRDEGTSIQYGMIHHILAKIPLLFSFGYIFLLLQPPQLPPPEVQEFMSNYAHTLNAVVCSIILYSICVPENYPSFSKPLHYFLSSDIWKYIADASYISYAIHFTICMKMLFVYYKPPFDINAIAASNPDLAVKMLDNYMLKTLAYSALMSLTMAFVINKFYEQPMLQYLQKRLKLYSTTNSKEIYEKSE